MAEETGKVYEWRIENLSHWCAEVHGECINSIWLRFPGSVLTGLTFSIMQLYPKGIDGKGEHLVVRLCEVGDSFSGDLSFYSSDGSLFCQQPVNSEEKTDFLEFRHGPKFEDVLSRIREGFLTVKLRIKSTDNFKRSFCTAINVLKISVKMNPWWIEVMESNETKEFFYIQLPPDDNVQIMRLKICSEDDTVHFMIEPPTQYEVPFAVEMSFKGSTKEHVFRDDNPWTFPESLQKKELLKKEISLVLCLKTRELIQGSFHMNCANSCVSIAPNNTLYFPEIEPPTDRVSSINDSVEVLTKELMCLYQDQDFSDITLKCDNVSFPVHKIFLSARSPFFKTMLSTDMAEATSGEVDIEDLDPSTLGLFLTHLYTGTVEQELQCDRAIKLYYAADKYQVPSLKRDCSKFLCSNVSVSNVCDILSLADKQEDDQLTSGARECILNNYNDVLKSKEWESFMCREPLLAVKTVTHFATKDSVRKHNSK